MVGNVNWLVSGVTAVFPHPAAACPVPDMSGLAYRSVTGSTGCVPVSGGGLRDPGVCWIGNQNPGRFGFVLLRNPNQHIYPGSRVSASAPVTTGISFGIWSGTGSDSRGRETPPRFPVSSSTGTTSVPPGNPPHQIALRSSSGFCSSNFWSTMTSFVGSPPLPRNENSRLRAYNCSDDDGRQQHKICLLKHFHCNNLIDRKSELLHGLHFFKFIMLLPIACRLATVK